jgi:hypothetical protein
MGYSLLIERLQVRQQGRLDDVVMRIPQRCRPLLNGRPYGRSDAEGPGLPRLGLGYRHLRGWYRGASMCTYTCTYTLWVSLSLESLHLGAEVGEKCVLSLQEV